MMVGFEKNANLDTASVDDGNIDDHWFWIRF
jgi:hypothetical protein